MAKLPAMHLYTGDWKKDQDLSKCSAATRGVWIDLLCAMHDDDRSGKASGTIEGLAKIARCTPDECQVALWELALNDAADILIECPDGVRNLSAECPRFVRDLSGHFPDEFRTYVTVINRRMSREYLDRCKSLERKQKERERKRVSRDESRDCHGNGHENVTPYSSSSSSTSVPPPSVSAECHSPVRSPSEEEEGALVIALRRRGISAAKRAVELANADGKSPADIRAIIAEYDANPGAWEAGALYQRVAGNLADWPEPSPESVRARSRDQQNRSAAKLRDTFDQQNAEKSANDRRNAELAAKYGPKIDALDCAQQQQLIREHCEEGEAKFLLKHVTKAKLGNLARERLIEIASELDTG